MTQEQAIQVLVQAVMLGQSKGAYTLDEAEVIKKAVDAFKPAEQQQEAEQDGVDAPAVKRTRKSEK
jgi:hypothetical protein